LRENNLNRVLEEKTIQIEFLRENNFNRVLVGEHLE